MVFYRLIPYFKHLVILSVLVWSALGLCAVQDWYEDPLARFVGLKEIVGAEAADAGTFTLINHHIGSCAPGVTLQRVTAAGFIANAAAYSEVLRLKELTGARVVKRPLFFLHEGTLCAQREGYAFFDRSGILQGFAALFKRTLILSFTGAEEPESLWTGLQAQSINVNDKEGGCYMRMGDQPSCFVHEACASQLKPLLPSILLALHAATTGEICRTEGFIQKRDSIVQGLLHQMVDPSLIEKVLVTGHGFRGALATLYAYELSLGSILGIPLSKICPVECISIGSPRVFLEESAKWLCGMVQGFSLVRVTRWNDPMTAVPGGQTSAWVESTICAATSATAALVRSAVQIPEGPPGAGVAEPSPNLGYKHVGNCEIRLQGYGWVLGSIDWQAQHCVGNYLECLVTALRNDPHLSLAGLYGPTKTLLWQTLLPPSTQVWKGMCDGLSGVVGGLWHALWSGGFPAQGPHDSSNALTVSTETVEDAGEFSVIGPSPASPSGARQEQSFPPEALSDLNQNTGAP